MYNKSYIIYFISHNNMMLECSFSVLKLLILNLQMTIIESTAFKKALVSFTSSSLSFSLPSHRQDCTYYIILVISSVSTLLLQAWDRGFWAKRTQMLRILDRLSSGMCCTFVKVQAFCELVPVNRAQTANDSKRGCGSWFEVTYRTPRKIIYYRMVIPPPGQTSYT